MALERSDVEKLITGERRRALEYSAAIQQIGEQIEQLQIQQQELNTLKREAIRSAIELNNLLELMD